VDSSGYTVNWWCKNQFGTSMPIGEEESIPLLRSSWEREGIASKVLKNSKERLG
jgi:hypothetical protein